MQVLSVDLASKDPRDLGIAVLRAGTRPRVEFTPPERLHLIVPLQAAALAGSLARLAQSLDCAWIAVDGPSGWKHPDNGLVHSRVGDRELNAPAKVGLPGQVRPRAYTSFIDFSIRVFDALSDLGYRRLASATTPASQRTSIEILPVACWPRLQLPRLPAKAKCTPVSLQRCQHALSSIVDFASPPSHDELQATVAGVAVLWLLLGKQEFVDLAGIPPVILDGHWREGLILAPSKAITRWRLT